MTNQTNPSWPLWLLSLALLGFSVDGKGDTDEG